jgi:hypothetical protein
MRDPVAQQPLAIVPAFEHGKGRVRNIQDESVASSRVLELTEISTMATCEPSEAVNRHPAIRPIRESAFIAY